MCDSTETPKGYDVGPLREKLAKWTGNPMNLQDFIQVGTADCHDRAIITIPAKWGVLQTSLKISDLQPGETLVTRTAIELAKPSFKPKIIAFCSDAKWGGATSTVFSGFHYVLFLATGADSDKKAFCVVYDPDVTATDKSTKAWASCSTGVDKTKPANAAVLKTMVLGDGANLGALVRYHYGS
jgi:hypothetical protein